MNQDNPTIAAIATAAGPGGIGIVRMSGATAIIIAEQLFHSKNCPIFSRLQGYNMSYGTIEDKQSAGNQTQIKEMFPEMAPPAENNGSNSAPASEIIDEAICLVFRSPKSYTGEDVVEFHCHGNQVVLHRVLDAVLRAGARLAEPGEFTRRAYLNGRIDLAKAEAVMQLISAGSEQAARAATAAMGGALSCCIAEIRQSLIAQAAQIAAWVDYPEEEFDDPQTGQIMAVLTAAAAQLNQLIRRSASAQAVISGVNTAIIGPPNAGKSSLMNLLAGYDRSIVTEIPGTTRDTVTETIQLGSITLRLTDTAGLRQTDDAIERIGVARSQAALAGAELVLAVFDLMEPVDQTLLAQCPPARTIVIFNKSDLAEHVPSINFPAPQVVTSALRGEGIGALTKAIEALLGASDFSPNEAILANHRQAETARTALAALEDATQTLSGGFPLDAVSICIEDAIQALFSLTGERATESVVDEVFAHFCVGK